jgi:protease secretion system membrane fusion protein
MNLVNKNKDVTDVVPHELEEPEMNTDSKSLARTGWMIVIFGVVGFLIWASFAPLDQGVPMSGHVVVASSRKVIQHQTGGLVDEILVQDGDVVKEGQPLVKMNSVNASAAAEVARVQLYTAQASEARLMAERDGASSINFNKIQTSGQKDPRVQLNMQMQQQLFNARQSALHSELAAVDEAIRGLEFQLQGLTASMINKKEQQQFLKEQVVNMRDLAKDGYVAKNRLLDAERAFSQVNGNISEDIGQLGRVNSQIAEMKLKKSQRLQEYQKEVRTQLSDFQREAEALANRVKALDFELKNVYINSPVDGTVVNLSVFTKGAVVPGGFKIMEVVPTSDALVVEGQLPVHLIDKVHKGLKVQLIFSAFNSNTTPHLHAVITEISADRTVDERTGAPYYKIRAQVAPEDIKLLSTLHVRPGMPADMVVTTGSRTMMNYILRPLTDRVHIGMIER